MGFNRRDFLQALGAFGIGSALPGGKSPEIEIPQDDGIGNGYSIPSSGGSVTGAGGTLYCKKAGIRAEILSVSITHGGIDVTTMADASGFHRHIPRPPTMDFVLRLPSGRSKWRTPEWCFANKCDWAVVFNDNGRIVTKGFLTHCSYNADAYREDMDTINLTVQVVGNPVYQAN